MRYYKVHFCSSLINGNVLKKSTGFVRNSPPASTQLVILSQMFLHLPVFDKLFCNKIYLKGNRKPIMRKKKGFLKHPYGTAKHFPSISNYTQCVILFTYFYLRATGETAVGIFASFSM
jgi:hypothetical protein